MTKKNQKKRNSRRSLAAIALDIQKVECTSIFQIGKLLLEAKDQCEHGEWLDWLSREFAWSPRAAHYYIKAAELVSKFATVANLKVPVTTIYALSDLDDADVPKAITRLSAASKKGRVTAAQGCEIVESADKRQE